MPMPYVMTDPTAKIRMLEELQRRKADVDVAIERLEAKPVLREWKELQQGKAEIEAAIERLEAESVLPELGSDF
jgi:hypothetical protein